MCSHLHEILRRVYSSHDVQTFKNRPGPITMPTNFGRHIYADGDLQNFVDESVPRLLEVKAWGFSHMHDKIELSRPIPSDPNEAFRVLVALRAQCRMDGNVKLQNEWFGDDPTKDKYKKVALLAIVAGCDDCLDAEADFEGICATLNEKSALSQKVE